jgi:hypothetical protein
VPGTVNHSARFLAQHGGGDLTRSPVVADQLLGGQPASLQRCLKGHPLFIVNVTNDGKSLNLMI